MRGRSIAGPNQDQFDHVAVSEMKDPTAQMVEDAIEEAQETLNKGTKPHGDKAPFKRHGHSTQKPEEHLLPKKEDAQARLFEHRDAHHTEDVHSEPLNEKDSSSEHSVPREEEAHTENKLTPKALEREEHLPEGLTREELQSLERLEKEKISFKHGDTAFHLRMVFLNQCYRDEKAAFERTKREIANKEKLEHIRLASLERTTLPTFFTDFISELEDLKSCTPEDALSRAESLFKNRGSDLMRYRSDYAAINRPCPFDFTAMSSELESFRKKLIPLLEQKINPQ